MSIERGTLLYRTGRFDQAEQEYRAALATEPANAVAHAMVGLCLLRRQRYDDAEGEARQAAQLAPDSDVGYATMAAVLRERRRFAEAADAIGRAIGLAPFDPDHRAVLADVRLQQRRWPDALAAADAGLAVDPRHPACVNARGVALVQLGRRDEAAVTLGGALARDPHSAATHANQGWALLHAGDHRAALEHFREALRINPDLDWAKRGIVEALQARRVVYRVMLRYFLFMSRLGRQAQWGIIIGGYVGYRLLASAVVARPGLAPFVLPVLLAYVAFAVLTWLAGPAFNLMLRVDRFGRYALSADQRRASNLLGGCLLVAAGLAVTWGVTRDSHYLLATLVAGVLSIPATSVFRLSRGWPRAAMAAATMAVTAVGVGWVLTTFAGPRTPAAAAGIHWGGLFLYGLLGVNLLSNALAGVRVRR